MGIWIIKIDVLGQCQGFNFILVYSYGYGVKKVVMNEAVTLLYKAISQGQGVLVDFIGDIS